MKRFSRAMATLCLAAAVAPVHATVVFTDNFDGDSSANWTFASSIAGDGPNDGVGSEATVNFDHAALVPSANGAAGTTKAMRVVSNIGGSNTFSGVTMTSTQQFDFATKPYRITADVWLNYYGGTTSGTTNEVYMGVGAANGTDQFYGGGFNSVMFATSTDGDTATDWRAYKTPWPDAGVGAVQQGPSGVYAAGTTSPDDPVPNSVLNSSHQYYVDNFPGGENPPALQANAFTNQQPGSIGLPASPGTVAFAWHRWTVETTPNGGPVKYYVSKADGTDVLIATIQGGDTNPYTMSGNSIYFGMGDINTGGPPSGFDAETLLFALIDNVKVEDLSVPPRIAGDTNGDGVVDLADLNNVLNNFGATGTSPGDDDGNGVVDLADLNRVLNNFGDTAAASALSVVPEPAAGSVLAIAALAAAARRRRSD